MKKEAGFTLVELMTVIAIIGIMAATAMPLYKTFQHRAYGSEALLMVKQILNAQIIYFLDKNEFFPGNNVPIDIYHGDLPSDEEIQLVKDNLNITINVGKFLDYNLESYNIPGDESFTVVVTVTGGKNFPLFQGGNSPGQIIGWVTKNGDIELIIP